MAVYGISPFLWQNKQFLRLNGGMGDFFLQNNGIQDVFLGSLCYFSAISARLMYQEELTRFKIRALLWTQHIQKCQIFKFIFNKNHYYHPLVWPLGFQKIYISCQYPQLGIIRIINSKFSRYFTEKIFANFSKSSLLTAKNFANGNEFQERNIS